MLSFFTGTFSQFLQNFRQNFPRAIENAAAGHKWPAGPGLDHPDLDYAMRIFFESRKPEKKFSNFDFRIIDAARQNRRLHDYRGTADNRGLGYADDIELFFFYSADDFQKAVVMLNDIFSQFGLKVNARKTVIMICNLKGKDQAYPQSICSLINLKLDNVQSFKYLGCQMQYNQASLGCRLCNWTLESTLQKLPFKISKLFCAIITSVSEQD